jgi:nucleotide-binding universal stress UspA family protein
MPIDEGQAGGYFWIVRSFFGRRTPVSSPLWKRILLATDFSPESAVAIPYAVAFARASGAEIVLAHVFPSGAGESRRAEARRQLDAVILPGADGVRVRRELLNGESASPALVDAAKRDGADVIVLSSHGRGVLGQLFLGSVAKDVIAGASCPVLCVKRGEEGLLDPATGRLRLSEVVAVVDDSPGSSRALEIASSFAALHEARLHLLYALAREIPATVFAPDGEPILHIDASLHALVRERRERLRHEIDARRADAKKELDPGTEERDIASYAKEIRADLVVVSREGIGDSISILGGAPVGLLHEIHCPLLLV